MGAAHGEIKKEALQAGLSAAIPAVANDELTHILDGLTAEQRKRLIDTLNELKTPRHEQCNELTAEQKGFVAGAPRPMTPLQPRPVTPPQEQCKAAVPEQKSTAQIAEEHGLKEVEIRGFVKAFQSVDTDNSGAIEAPELQQVMKSLGQDLSDEEAANVVKACDKNFDGKVDLEEFVAFVADAFKALKK